MERSHIFAHGLLCVRVVGLSLCVTHLNPHDGTRRVEEARVIAKHAATDDSFMLVGDLNTLSALDRAVYDAADLPARIRSGPYAKQLGRKFLDRSRLKVDYKPMQVLLNHPLVDVGESGGPSVPTSINADHMHFATLRLDYCLVNTHLLESCGGQRGLLRATPLHNRQTDTLSDHFPLEIVVNSPESRRK